MGLVLGLLADATCWPNFLNSTTLFTRLKFAKSWSLCLEVALSLSKRKRASPPRQIWPRSMSIRQLFSDWPVRAHSACVTLSCSTSRKPCRRTTLPSKSWKGATYLEHLESRFVRLTVAFDSHSTLALCDSQHSRVLSIQILACFCLVVCL